MQDAYKSILEAFVHAGVANECKVHVVPMASEEITDANVAKNWEELDGILVAPGFGERGMRAKFMQSVMLVKTTYLSLVSVWECNVLLLNLLAMYWA